ncbi:MAG: hypothetical protein ABIQ31_17630 [Ferruginibacter sp.]
MNTKLLLLAISVAAFSSCTTLYKSGQTPDDVYYSPTRPAGYSEERTDRQSDQQTASTYSTYEDRTIRFGINDRRWRYLDYNFSNNPYINDYSYNPYNYGFNYGYYYNPYFWPYPVYSPIFITPSIPKNTTPRIANLSGYNPVYNNSNPSANTKTGGIRQTPIRGYNNTNNNTRGRSAVGNVIRQVFSPSNSNNSSNNSTNNSSTNNNRTYTPSTNTSSSSSAGSSSSGSGGGGAVSRPPRN